MTNNKKMITPMGSALWAKIITPDTKFNVDGLYSVDLLIDGNDGLNLKNKINELAEQQYNKIVDEFKSKGKPNEAKKVRVADTPFSHEVDDKGNETDTIKFKFKMKAKITGKDGKIYSQKPSVFDADGNECEVDIWNGSKIKVAFEVVPFYTALIGAGVSLRLKAIQIIELVSGSGGGSSSFGFKKEEGFSSSKKETVKKEVTNEEDVNFDPFDTEVKETKSDEDF